MEENDRLHTDMDWENRILCSDESCIGVIGPDGQCKECGLPFKGVLKSESSNQDEHTGSTDSEPDHVIKDEGSKIHPDTEWENRTLCRDESCIGVVGPDGKCKECGLLYNQE